MNETELIQPLPPDPAPPREPFWGYDDLALFLGAAIPSWFIALLVLAGLRRLPGGAGGIALEALIVQSIAYALWFGALYLLLRVRFGRPFWASLGWILARRPMAVGLYTGPALALAVGILGAMLDPGDVDMPMRQLLTNKYNIILVGIFAVTLGPVCEELAFRGFLQPLIARTFGPMIGILAPAAAFGLLHGPEYGWSWVHVLIVSLAGIAFGWMRYKTGSTAAAAAMHATYNLTFLAGFLFQQGDQFGS